MARLTPERRRAQLIESTLRLLEDRSPAVIGAEEIATAAGVSRALLYRYFADVDELLAAAHQRFFELLQQDLDEILDEATDAETAVRHVVDRYFQFASSNGPTYSYLLDSRFVRRAEIRHTRQQRLERLAQLWGGTTHAVLVASAAMGALETATLAWLERGHRDDMEQAAALVWRLVWSGLPSVPISVTTDAAVA